MGAYNWSDIPAGWQPTTMLPAEGEVQETSDVGLDWGQGTGYLVTISAAAAEADELVAVERHVIVQAGDQRAFDFYASASNAEVLEEMEPVLQHMLDSAQLTTVAEGTETPAEEQAVKAAREALAQQLEIPVDEITVQVVQPVEWSDACLGLPAEGEACAQVVTPGFVGVLQTPEQLFEFRTDRSGQVVRLVPGAVLIAQQALVQQLHVDFEVVEIVAFEAAEWPSSCLGVELEGQFCAQVVTPGYRVVLGVNGDRYAYHISASADNLVLAEAPEVDVQNVMVEWRNEQDGCREAMIGPETVAVGMCGGPMVAGQFVSEERRTELEHFVETYPGFTAETNFGTVVLDGKGQQDLSPARQRAIAAWAQLVYLEALAGRGGASWGLVMAWHREGGIAGFCDDLSVYVSGKVFASSCQGEAPTDLGQGWLTDDQLELLYDWVDVYESFELEETEPASGSEQMTIRLIFSGEGLEEPSAEQKQEMQAWAAEVFNEFNQTSNE